MTVAAAAAETPKALETTGVALQLAQRLHAPLQLAQRLHARLQLA